MVNASQTAFLRSTKSQGNAAVAAIFVENADLSFAVAESDEILTEQLDMDRIAIRVWQLRTQQRGHPEVPHRLAHRRVGAGAAHELIVFCRQNPSVSLLNVRDPSWSPASLQNAIGKSFAHPRWQGASGRQYVPVATSSSRPEEPRVGREGVSKRKTMG